MNYNAEVILIIYPHGAGGRFLELLLGSPTVSVDEFKQLIRKQKRLAWMDQPQGSFLWQSEFRDQYVIAVHDDIPSEDNLLKFSNLKIIAVVATTDKSVELLGRRRKYLGSPALGINETSLRSTFFEGMHPASWVEIEELWEPVRGVARVKSLLAQFNIENEHAEDLYHIWHQQTIAPI